MLSLNIDGLTLLEAADEHSLPINIDEPAPPAHGNTLAPSLFRVNASPTVETDKPAPSTDTNVSPLHTSAPLLQEDEPATLNSARSRDLSAEMQKFHEKVMQDFPELKDNFARMERVLDAYEKENEDMEEYLRVMTRKS